MNGLFPEKLIFFDNIRDDALVRKAVRLCRACDGIGAAPFDGALREDYYEVQRALMSEYGNAAAAPGFAGQEVVQGFAGQAAGGASAPGPTGAAEAAPDSEGQETAPGGPAAAHTFWQHHVCRLIAESENAFSLAAEKGASALARFGGLVEREAGVLKAIYGIGWGKMAASADDGAFCVAAMELSPGGAASRQDGTPGATPRSRAAAPGRRSLESKREAVHRAMLRHSDRDSAEMLEKYYRDEGGGLFERYDAFYWDGRLVGVESPDPITFDDLIGYGIQKGRIIENVKFFTEGRLGLNMLLYGDRGTGKSSSVKALLNMFAPRKLRLVSVPKEEIAAIPAIMEALAARGLRFIIFIDDLSFEENETGYKSFKSALEGGVRPQPENVLVCVTSNRRNIIKEVWRDREGGEDIHINDSLQEKRSLADRFGLTVVFSSPDKYEYLDIVKGIAEREGLNADIAELESEAMKWEIRQNGRSGRGARQFINWFSRGKNI
ncbi:MAG: ATP-binding protein [Clostridiales Family XIII bacterium]|jgi:predicted AAA+ superfamily ATPase|nr:ATP-binding protein [Clostridiales Family XIII bacterium]